MSILVVVLVTVNGPSGDTDCCCDGKSLINNEIKEDQDFADLLVDSDEPSLSSSDTLSTGDNVLDSLQNSISSPLFSLMKSEFGGLFYNVKDTISINNILTNDQVKLLIPCLLYTSELPTIYSV